MASDTTRPGEISTREAEKLAEAIVRRGAMIDSPQDTRKDSRLTLVFQWVAGIGGAVVVLMLAWIGNTLLEVRQDVAVIKATDTIKNAQLDRVESQVSNIDKRLTQLEAKAK